MFSARGFIRGTGTCIERTMDSQEDLAAWLETRVRRYEVPAFIDTDPISIPTAFSEADDRAIAGLFAALLAWGQRVTMLRKLEDLMERMHYQPARYVYDFDEMYDGAALDGFVHRTFHADDARWLCKLLRDAWRSQGSIEGLFARHLTPSSDNIGGAIEGFSRHLLEEVQPSVPTRLAKHLARPSRGSAAKRLCMFLRWMVRSGPVDFGLWTNISPAQLVLPVDTHSARVARSLGLLSRKQNDWKAAEELTLHCKQLDPSDPARFDFALYGAGVNGER